MNIKLYLLTYYAKFLKFIRIKQGKYVEIQPSKYNSEVINDRLQYLAKHGGGTLNLGSGIYECTSQIIIPSSNIAIQSGYIKLEIKK